MKIKSNIKLLISIFSIILLSACGGTSEEEASQENNEGAIQVVTSFYPMYEFTNEIAGDRANVEIMVDAGADAHGYEPSAQDVAEVTEADVFVYSSEDMEFWVSNLLESIENEGLTVVRAADGLNNSAEEQNAHQEEEQVEAPDDTHSHSENEEGHHHHDEDPHIWLDPVYAQSQVDVITDSLIEADPEGEEIYTQNAEDFKEELQTLHEDYETELAGAENRTFVVQHEAFGFLADRYDLNQVAVGGISTEVEPNPSRIAEIGDIVNESGVPVIYYQSGADSSIAETVAEETGTEVEALFDLETQTEEMQEEELDYIGAMRHNLEALKSSIH